MAAGLVANDPAVESVDLLVPRRRDEDKNLGGDHHLVALLREIPSSVVVETVALQNDNCLPKVGEVGMTAEALKDRRKRLLVRFLRGKK